MTEDTPLVSIVIPVYNGSNYLSEAIKSALEQSYKNIEIIVVNDGSNDSEETRRIAESFGSKIRYFEKVNGGVSSALNLGIKEMRGDYFAWLSHDDIYHPDNISIQIKSNEGLNNNFVLACSTTVFETSFSFTPKLKQQKKIILSRPLDFFSKGWVFGCSLLIPKNILTEINGFNDGNKTTQDIELIWEILRVTEIHMINDILVFRRVHEEQGYQNPNIIKINVKESIALLKDKINKFGVEYFSNSKKSEFKKGLIFLYLAFNYSLDRRLVNFEGYGPIKWLIDESSNSCPFFFNPIYFLKFIPIKVIVNMFVFFSFFWNKFLRLRTLFSSL